MKYCIVSAQYLPSAGGVERYTYNLIQKLLERKNEVILVTSYKKGLPKKEKTDDGLVIYRVKTLQVANGRMPMTFNGKGLRTVMEEVKLYKIDRIVIQTRLYTLSLLFAKFAHKNRIPYLVIEHGSNYVDTSKTIIGKCTRAYERIILRKIRRYNPDFFAVSEAGKDWLRTINIDAKGVLYNSVNVDEVKNYICNSTVDIRKKYGIPEKSKIICFVGRMIAAKGIFQLVEAFRNIQKKYDVYLLMVGNGGDLDKLDRYESDKIIYTGEMEYRNTIEILDQSDIFCLPSDSEGMPTTVMEAILAGTYVITTERGGAKEIITSKEYGTIMKGNSVREIESAMINALEDEESCNKAIVKVYRRFLNGFTWDNTCDCLETLDR